MSKIDLKTVNQILSNKEMKNVLGGAGTTSCSNSCGVSITDCNGTCTASGNCVTCKGATQTLTKCCNSNSLKPLDPFEPNEMSVL